MLVLIFKKPARKGSSAVSFWLGSKRWSSNSTCFLDGGFVRFDFRPFGFIGSCKPAGHCIPAEYVDLYMIGGALYYSDSFPHDDRKCVQWQYVIYVYIYIKPSILHTSVWLLEFFNKTAEGWFETRTNISSSKICRQSSQLANAFNFIHCRCKGDSLTKHKHILSNIFPMGCSATILKYCFSVALSMADGLGTFCVFLWFKLCFLTEVSLVFFSMEGLPWRRTLGSLIFFWGEIIVIWRIRIPFHRFLVISLCATCQHGCKH